MYGYGKIRGVFNTFGSLKAVMELTQALEKIKNMPYG